MKELVKWIGANGQMCEGTSGEFDPSCVAFTGEQIPNERGEMVPGVVGRYTDPNGTPRALSAKIDDEWSPRRARQAVIDGLARDYAAEHAAGRLP